MFELQEIHGNSTEILAAGDRALKDSLEATADASLLDTSCKLQFLLQLLPELRRQGHRTLVFTSTRIMLDLVEAAICKVGLSSVRIDGTVVSKERQRRVRQFNDGGVGDVMLLTIGVGGVGLTLTAASRVVLFSPDWNPTRDRQAIDRCFRIGQCKNVIAYRLVTCNTVEESVYRRCVEDRHFARRYEIQFCQGMELKR